MLLPQFPDGNYLKPMELNCVEKQLQSSLAKNYNDRILTIGRTAIITEGPNQALGELLANIEAGVEGDAHMLLILVVTPQLYLQPKAQET